MDKYIGRLLDGRYEILEEIGRGGMAVVYRARCHRLNRFVAVKILKEELSRDEDFRRRFHAESQAVAMLSHPNIVAVYDVNHSGDADYIVMELIDGLTLKQYMQQRGALNWREALHFATQIAKALEHAHSRGIVHRDIKPHNIMILKDGSVKVADFGIARLNSSQNTLTREALGSVHYISPEQAKGAQVDARSDLYSLGVVMYEMLTGRPPYDGESPVAIAIQHINSTPTPPRQLNPSIPLGLQQITLHAMCSDLSARYASATAMIEDLEALRKNPQVVFRFNAGPGGTTTYVDTRQIAAAQAAQTAQQSQRSTVPGAAAAPAAAGTAQRQSRSQGQQRTPVDPHQAARQKARTMAEKSVQNAGARNRSYNPEDYYEEDEEEEKRSSKTPIIIVSVLLVAVLILAAVLLRSVFGGGSGSGTVEVPSFLGQNIQSLLVSDAYPDFTLVEGEHVYNEKYGEGQVCDQSIASGKKVASGTTIRLTVSKGPQTSTMPELTGKTQQEAVTLLDGLELNLSVSYEFQESESVEEGKVISTEPMAGTTLSYGGSVKVVVSQGKGTTTVKVPNVIGMEEQSAASALEQAGLKVSVTREENDATEGTVFYQSISGDTEVPENTTVSIKISEGKKTGTMPNLAGKNQQEAAAALEALKLNLSISYEYQDSDSVEEGQIISTNPSSGSTLTDGDSVKLVVSQGKKITTVTVPNVIGLEEQDAVAALERVNLKVTVTRVENDAAEGTVFYQSITGNTDVPEETSVTIKVSAGKAEPSTAPTATPTETVPAVSGSGNITPDE